MLKCLVFSIFVVMAPIFSMHHLSEPDRLEIIRRIDAIQFAFDIGRDYFDGGAQSRQEYINEHVAHMERVFNRNSIPHPSNKTIRWLKQIKEEFEKTDVEKKSDSPKAVTDRPKNIEECDIAGLDKADVLKALLEEAEKYSPELKAFFETVQEGWVGQTNVTREDCVQALEKKQRFDYFDGKPLKVDLSCDKIFTLAYNREHGSGAAQRAIENLRKKENFKALPFCPEK